MSGAIAGSPSPTADAAACPTTPAPRIVQRYLRADPARVELTQLPNLVGVRAFAVYSGNLEQHRKLLQPRVSEERAESFTHQPFADVLVAVPVRAEGRLRVVRVQCAQAVEADLLVQVVEQRVECGGVRRGDARDVEVGRVETDAEPLVAVELVEDRRELVEGAPDRPARAGGVLHQHPRRLVAALEDLGK